MVSPKHLNSWNPLQWGVFCNGFRSGSGVQSYAAGNSQVVQQQEGLGLYS